MLGASGFEAFRLVTLPLILPGLVAGALFAFITSLDNVPVTIFLISANQTTLPVLIFTSVEMGVDPSVAAVSTLLIVAHGPITLLIAERCVRLPSLRLKRGHAAMPLTSKGFPLFLTFDLDAETMWTGRDPAYAKPPDPDVARRLWLEGRDRTCARSARSLRHQSDLLRPRPDHRSARGADGGDPPARPRARAPQLQPCLDPQSLTPEQEREEMEKGFQSIKRVSGRAPRGWRSPAAEISSITMPMLVEYGFDYSSNFFDDDSPYLHDVEGRETKIVELPFRWVLDDAPFFQYSIVLPGPHHAGAIRAARGLEGRVRRALRRGPHDDDRHAPGDDRPAVAHKGARGVDRACAEASECLDRALRRDRRRHAARRSKGRGGRRGA